MDAQTNPAGDTATASKQSEKQRPTVGDPLMKIGEVPPEVRDYAVNKLSPRDADGNRLKDENGKEVSARVAVARENGSYYGPVVLNNDKFIVQAVGKDGASAVVHPKGQVELKGDFLKTLDEKKRMNNFNVQIHYTGDKAKAFPLKLKEVSAERDQQKAEQAPKAEEVVKPETVLAKAQEYANENIKNDIQRATFMKHMEAMTQGRDQTQSAQKEAENRKRVPEQKTVSAGQVQAAQQVPKPVRQPVKQADQGIER